RIAEGLEKDVGDDLQDQSVAEMAGKSEDYQFVEGETEKEVVRLGVTISPASVCVESPSSLQEDSDDRALRTSVVSQIQGAQERPTNQKGDEDSGRGTRYLLRRKRTNSCPHK
ncbi:hypothetical protein A2U01_0060023, partial [Trifolium medium]|nr:hypothetical protein [Trifolium medium]